LGGTVLVHHRTGTAVVRVPEEQDNGTTRLLARLFGIRNITLGAWTLGVRDHGDEERRLCYQFNPAIDAADLGGSRDRGHDRNGLTRVVVMSSTLGLSALLAWLDLLGDVGSQGAQGQATLA
jgi:hypothetical protein